MRESVGTSRRSPRSSSALARTASSTPAELVSGRRTPRRAGQAPALRPLCLRSALDPLSLPRPSPCLDLCSVGSGANMTTAGHAQARRPLDQEGQSTADGDAIPPVEGDGLPAGAETKGHVERSPLRRGALNGRGLDARRLWPNRTGPSARRCFQDRATLLVAATWTIQRRSRERSSSRKARAATVRARARRRERGSFSPAGPSSIAMQCEWPCRSPCPRGRCSRCGDPSRRGVVLLAGDEAPQHACEVLQKARLSNSFTRTQQVVWGEYTQAIPFSTPLEATHSRTSSVISRISRPPLVRSLRSR